MSLKLRPPTPQELHVWHLRHTDPPRSWNEIATAIGVSRGAVRRMYAEAERRHAGVRPPDM